MILAVHAEPFTDNDPSTGLRRYRDTYDAHAIGTDGLEAWKTIYQCCGATQTVQTAPVGLTGRALQVISSSTPSEAGFSLDASGLATLCNTSQSLSFKGQLPDLASGDNWEYRMSQRIETTDAAPSNSVGFRFTGIIGAINNVNFFVRGPSGAVQLSATGTMTGGTTFTASISQGVCTGTPHFLFTITGATGLGTATVNAAASDTITQELSLFSMVNTVGAVGSTVWLDDWDYQGTPMPNGGPAGSLGWTAALTPAGGECAVAAKGQAVDNEGNVYVAVERSTGCCFSDETCRFSFSNVVSFTATGSIRWTRALSAVPGGTCANKHCVIQTLDLDTGGHVIVSALAFASAPGSAFISSWAEAYNRQTGAVLDAEPDLFSTRFALSGFAPFKTSVFTNLGATPTPITAFTDNVQSKVVLLGINAQGFTTGGIYSFAATCNLDNNPTTNDFWADQITNAWRVFDIDDGANTFTIPGTHSCITDGFQLATTEAGKLYALNGGSSIQLKKINTATWTTDFDAAGLNPTAPNGLLAGGADIEGSDKIMICGGIHGLPNDIGYAALWDAKNAPHNTKIWERDFDNTPSGTEYVPFCDFDNVGGYYLLEFVSGTEFRIQHYTGGGIPPPTTTYVDTGAPTTTTTAPAFGDAGVNADVSSGLKGFVSATIGASDGALFLGGLILVVVVFLAVSAAFRSLAKTQGIPTAIAGAVGGLGMMIFNTISGIWAPVWGIIMIILVAALVSYYARKLVFGGGAGGESKG